MSDVSELIQAKSLVSNITQAKADILDIIQAKSNVIEAQATLLDTLFISK